MQAIPILDATEEQCVEAKIATFHPARLPGGAADLLAWLAPRLRPRDPAVLLTGCVVYRGHVLAHGAYSALAKARRVEQGNGYRVDRSLYVKRPARGSWPSRCPRS